MEQPLHQKKTPGVFLSVGPVVVIDDDMAFYRG